MWSLGLNGLRNMPTFRGTSLFENVTTYSTVPLHTQQLNAALICSACSSVKICVLLDSMASLESFLMASVTSVRDWATITTSSIFSYASWRPIASSFRLKTRTIFEEETLQNSKYIVFKLYCPQVISIKKPLKCYNQAQHVKPKQNKMDWFEVNYIYRNYFL